MATNILIVDDNAALRMIMRQVLAGAGYTVFEAPDGKPALVVLREHPEGMIVLLDVQMPGMDGITLLRTIYKGEEKPCPHVFILVTSTDVGLLRPDEVELLSRLDVTVIHKPFDIERLEEAVFDAEQRIAALSA